MARPAVPGNKAICRIEASAKLKDRCSHEVIYAITSSIRHPPRQDRTN
jgi:hypothetical protein